MKIKELSFQKPFTITRNDNLDLAANLMWEHDSGVLSLNDAVLAYKTRSKKDLKAELIADTLAAICKNGVLTVELTKIPRKKPKPRMSPSADASGFNRAGVCDV